MLAENVPKSGEIMPLRRSLRCSQFVHAAPRGTSPAIAIRGGRCGGARGRDRTLRLPVTRLRPRTFCARSKWVARFVPARGQRRAVRSTTFLAATAPGRQHVNLAGRATYRRLRSSYPDAWRRTYDRCPVTPGYRGSLLAGRVCVNLGARWRVQLGRRPPNRHHRLPGASHSRHRSRGSRSRTRVVDGSRSPRRRAHAGISASWPPGTSSVRLSTEIS
jgi:hypothetical protein